MFCTYCGKEIPDNSNVCPFCGCPTKVENVEENRLLEQRAKKYGIIALCFFWFPIVSVPLAADCIILDKTGRQKGKAIISLVLSIIFVLLLAFVF